MDRMRRVGEKRIKEPSSYATSGNGQRTQQKSSAGHSLHQSFSNLSLHNSSKGISFWSPKESLTLSTRDRADSDCSRESETSALDRFLTRHYEAGVIKLSAKVSEKNGLMEFIVNLTVKDFGSKEWCVLRSVDDVIRFCERVRLAGAGYSFPMPPAQEDMMQCVTKAVAPLPVVPGLGPMESHESTSTQSSKKQGKPRHQKKRMNSGTASSGNGIATGIFRAMSARFSLSRGQSRRLVHEKVFPSVQEWFDAALEVWQKRWHSKSDEDGISLAFEGFLCDPSGKTSAPIDLLTAVDFVVLVTASAPNQNPALLMNKKREATIAKAAIRLARDYPEAISIDALKARVLAYAWEQFESNHSVTAKNLNANPYSFVSVSAEELPFMHLQVQPIITQVTEVGVRFAYNWTAHPQLASLRTNLIENFSVPPTPRSLDHFHDVWKSFSDVVILRVEQRLRAAAYAANAHPHLNGASSSSLAPSIPASTAAADACAVKRE